MNKRFWIITGLLALALGGLIATKSSHWASVWLWQLSGEGTRLFPLVSIAALIDSINPCAFSVLMLTIAFLISLGMTRGKLLTIGLSYIIGIYVAYLLIGLGLLQALHIFNTPHFMGKLGSGILIAWGILSIVEHFFPNFPIKLKIPSIAHGRIADLMEKSSIPAVFALGMLVGLCEFPCTGGPYLMVIGLLHDGANYWRGFWYLIWYNILFVSPLVAILFYAGDNATLGKLQNWKSRHLKESKLTGGLIMIALALLILMM